MLQFGSRAMIIFKYDYRNQCKLACHYVCEYIVDQNILLHNFIASAAEFKSRAHEMKKMFLKMICETRLPLEEVPHASDINI